jgi:hypothetical protein
LLPLVAYSNPLAPPILILKVVARTPVASDITPSAIIPVFAGGVQFGPELLYAATGLLHSAEETAWPKRAPALAAVSLPAAYLQAKPTSP